MQDNNKPVRKNSQARINANNKYKKANYKRIAVDIRPDQAEKIRETAQRYHLSLAQLIVQSVTEYDINHSDTTTADTVTASAPEDNAPDQQDTTSSNGSQIISRNTPSRNNSKSAGEAQ